MGNARRPDVSRGEAAKATRSLLPALAIALPLIIPFLDGCGGKHRNKSNSEAAPATVFTSEAPNPQRAREYQQFTQENPGAWTALWSKSTENLTALISHEGYKRRKSGRFTIQRSASSPRRHLRSRSRPAKAPPSDKGKDPPPGQEKDKQKDDKGNEQGGGNRPPNAGGGSGSSTSGKPDEPPDSANSDQPADASSGADSEASGDKPPVEVEQVGFIASGPKQKAVLLSFDASEPAVSPNNDGVKDRTNLSFAFALRTTDGLNALDHHSPKADEKKFFLDWTVALSQNGAALRTFQARVPVQPPLSDCVSVVGLQQEKDESQSGIESDGTDEGGCHFVRLKAQTEWDATDDAGAVMTDGNYETVVSAVFVREDILGNGEMKAKTVDSLSTVSASVKVDTVPPAISLLPENNLITSDRFLPIAVNVSDPLSGIDQSSMMLTLDGADLLKGLAMSDGEFTFVPPRAV